MAIVTSDTDAGLQEIGEIAGFVWHALNAHGPLSLAKLAKQIEAPRDVAILGVGWLAREGKVVLEESHRGRVVSLR